MPPYETNLAAEYYILSCLHRRGLTANLTLGNKKGVDVVVVRDSGDAVTVEVKGLAGKYEWPANNLVSQKPKKPENHFVALVSFEGLIGEPSMPPPSVWIVPFPELGPFIRYYPGGRVNVMRSKMVSDGGRFKSAWYLVEGVSGG
jgi:hypothetical protein